MKEIIKLPTFDASAAEKYVPPKVSNKLITAESMAMEEFKFYLTKIKTMMEPGCRVTFMCTHPTDASKHMFVSEEDSPETVIHKITEIMKRIADPKVGLPG